MSAQIIELSQVRAAEAANSTAAATQEFLADLEQQGRSQGTLRAYRADLRPLAAACPLLREITPGTLRALFAGNQALAPATRARRQAAVASFTSWAYRQELLDFDPMGRVGRVRLQPPVPRGLTPQQTGALLAAIPTTRTRDRALFTLMASTGLRAGEALGLHVEDIVITRDDERLVVLGKGGRQRTVLLDDPVTVRLLRRHLLDTGYQRGPVFRAERGQSQTALSYQGLQQRFASYASLAGLVGASPHDLRHGHAQHLVNGGVSLATIRKRLGHANINTTLRYAEQADATTDAEMRAWRRRS